MHRGKGDRKKGGGRMAKGRILNSKYKRRVTFALVSQKICCLQDARKPPPPLPPCTTRALESMHKAEVHSLSAHVPFTWLALFDLCFRHILKFDDVRLIRKKILVVWCAEVYFLNLFALFDRLFREHSFRRKFGSFFLNY